MSRIRSKLPSSGGGEVAKPIYDNFDQRSKDELLDDLTDWLDTADEKNFDEERLDALLGALNEKDPQEDFDAEAHYAQFRQKFQPLFETNDAKPAAKHSRKTFRKLIPIAAVIALLLAGTITAQAFGLDIFGAIARWTSSTFGFSSSDEPYATIGHYPIAEGETKEYASLQEALDDFQVSGQLAPTWIPERFELESVTATVNKDGAFFRATYDSLDGSTLSVKQVSIIAQIKPPQKKTQRNQLFEKQAEFSITLLQTNYTSKRFGSTGNWRILFTEMYPKAKLNV